jgi:hypothetical protein
MGNGSRQVTWQPASSSPPRLTRRQACRHRSSNATFPLVIHTFDTAKGTAIQGHTSPIGIQDRFTSPRHKPIFYGHFPAIAGERQVDRYAGRNGTAIECRFAQRVEKAFTHLDLIDMTDMFKNSHCCHCCLLIGNQECDTTRGFPVFVASSHKSDRKRLGTTWVCPSYEGEQQTSHVEIFQLHHNSKKG